jgi:hypothetical protein
MVSTNNSVMASEPFMDGNLDSANNSQELFREVKVRIMERPVSGVASRAVADLKTRNRP